MDTPDAAPRPRVGRPVDRSGDAAILAAALDLVAERDYERTTLDEVAAIVRQSTREGMLVDASGTVTAAFEFTTKTVSDVAVPLAEMVLLPWESTPADVRRAVAVHGYSRYLLAGADGLLVAGRSADRRGAELNFSPASERVRSKYERLPVLARE